MPNLPRAILFDLDDTVISAYGRPAAAWALVLGEYTQALEGLDAGVIGAAIRKAADGLWGDPEQHRIWRHKMRDARRRIVAAAFDALADAGHKVPGAEVQTAIADRFSDHRNQNLALFPDSLATLDALRARGVRLALITNGAAQMQREKVARFDLARRFDHIQIEGEHGFGKPEERAYRHALRMLDAAAHEAWIVGDNLEWEVIAPQKLGIHAIWYDPQGDGVPAGHAARPDRIIRRLSELRD